MKKFLFLTGVFLSSCLAVDTKFPPSAPGPSSPTCNTVDHLYWELGNPAYCYPDMCCIWTYYDYDGWYCEEEWCEYNSQYDCWWEQVELECW